MPSILFLHENYPAQFGALADYLARTGWRVVFATQRGDVPDGKPLRQPSGVYVLRYSRARQASSATHPYLRSAERAVLNGQAFARLGAALAKGGFAPDIIVAHSGWGSGSFAKTVWPRARLVQYLEWWYGHPAVDGDPEEADSAPAEDRHAQALTRNLPFLLDFQPADLVIAPTRFQADQAPDFVRDRLVVQHDGVDYGFFCPAREGDAPYAHPDLPDTARTVTFATRGMEPVRGFPTFMAAASELQRAEPDLHIVIAGEDRAHYGPAPRDHPTWKAKALSEHRFDPSRLHFTGHLPRDDYARLLRRSSAHVYLTRPFVLSWSLIEAMASGCPIVATDVEPVREALGAARAARLVPTGDVAAVVRQVSWCLSHPDEARALGQTARETSRPRFDAANCFPAMHHILRDLLPDPARSDPARKATPGPH